MSDRGTGPAKRSVPGTEGFSTRAIRAGVAGGMLAFEVEGGRTVGLEDVEDLQTDLAAILESVASARESVPALGAI